MSLNLTGTSSPSYKVGRVNHTFKGSLKKSGNTCEVIIARDLAQSELLFKDYSCVFFGASTVVHARNPKYLGAETGGL